MPSNDDIHRYLQKVLQSRALSGSDQLKRLLQVVVERTSTGQADTVKEYTLGIEAFGRSDGYDPKIDPIVRVQARRLRTKLDEYYNDEGAEDAIRITLPKGGYVPSFEERTSAPQTTRVQRWPILVGSVLVLTGLGAWIAREQVVTDSKSVAVLPMRNISGDASRQFLADQATEALLTNLARIKGLRVVSGTTTRNFADSHDSLPTIAKALNVHWIVEGSAGEENGRVLLKMRLVDAASDRKMWADIKSCAADDLSATQAKAASEIAAAIEHPQALLPR